MEKRLFVYVALFTVFVCCIFVAYNPNIATSYPTDFSDGDVIVPQGGHFDFKDFSLNCSGAENFTARIMSNGHVQFYDDTGDITINYIELDKMIRSKRDQTENLLNHELKNPSWSLDGVMVHEIDFLISDDLYSAYQKNSDTNAIIYLSSPSVEKTAEMMNTLKFKEE